MKSRKKVLAMLLSCLLILTMVPTVAFANGYSITVTLNGYSLGAKADDVTFSESSDTVAIDRGNSFIFKDKDGQADWDSEVTEFEADTQYWLVLALTKQDGTALANTDLTADDVNLTNGYDEETLEYDDGLWWVYYKLKPFDAPVPGTYNITFNANGGSVTPESAFTGDDGKLETLPTPTHSNDSAVFTGWHTEKSGGTAVTADTVFTSNATIYAQWTMDYAITVTLNGYSLGANAADVTFSESSDSVDIDLENSFICTDDGGAPDWSSEVAEFEAGTQYWLVLALTKQGGADLAETDLTADDVNLTNKYTEEELDYDDNLLWVCYKLVPLSSEADNPSEPADPTDPKEEAKDDAAQTGDDSNMMIWLTLMILAAVGATGTAMYRRKA